MENYFIKIGRKYIRINANDILYISISTKPKHIKIKTKQQEYIVSQTLNRIYEYLPAEFIKLNRSQIVNINNIEYVDDNHIVFSGCSEKMTNSYSNIFNIENYCLDIEQI